jgi:hypothetical protein
MPFGPLSRAKSTGARGWIDLDIGAKGGQQRRDG